MEAITAAVVQGVGLSAFLEQDPRATGLVRIATNIKGPLQPFYLVYHRDLKQQPHVREAIAAIERHLRAHA